MNTTKQVIKSFGALLNRKKAKPRVLNILIVSNDSIQNESLQNLLEKHKCSIALNGQVAQEFLKANEYDILISAYNLPCMTGHELSQLAKAVFPELKSILIYKTGSNPNFIHNTFVEGYLNKRTIDSKINEVVDKVMTGEKYIDWIKVGKIPSLKNHLSKIALSNRETEILRLMTENNSTKQIAQLLMIHESTVNSYINNLLIKTGNSNSSNLINYAIARNLIAG